MPMQPLDLSMHIQHGYEDYDERRSSQSSILTHGAIIALAPGTGTGTASPGSAPIPTSSSGTLLRYVSRVRLSLALLPSYHEPA